MTLMSQAVRMRCDFVRVPLIAALFLPHYVEYVVFGLLPARWGGMDDKRRALRSAFWLVPIDIALAGMRGEFVGLPPRSR